MVKDTLARLHDLPKDLRPNALIIADPGVLRLAARIAPDYPVHLSTQANTANSESLAFWRDQGVTRVNLARELNIKDIRSLAEAAHKAGGPELEVFVHGAACMAVSGRCHLSTYLNQRSANQGLCTHVCRFQYEVTGLALTERTRPGQPVWELHEEDGYSALLSANDICLLKYLAWFKNLGITSLKIEGRMRTAGWLAQVVDVYATALKDLGEKRFRWEDYARELRNASLRSLDSAMFLPGSRRWSMAPLPEEEKRPVLARVLEQIEPGKWRVAVKSRWEAGQDVEVMLPGLERVRLRAGEYSLEDEEGSTKEEVHSGVEALLRPPVNILAPGFLVRAA